MDREESIVLIVLGSLLLANPLYLDALIRRGGGGFGISFLYDALFAAVGMLSMASGLLSSQYSPVEIIEEWTLVGIALLGTIIPVSEVFLSPTLTIEDVLFAWNGHRELFIASVAGLAFLGSAALARQSWRLLVAGLALPLPLFLLAAGGGAPFGPVLDLILVSLNAEILRVPGIGIVLYLTAGLVGWAVATVSDMRPR